MQGAKRWPAAKSNRPTPEAKDEKNPPESKPPTEQEEMKKVYIKLGAIFVAMCVSIIAVAAGISKCALDLIRVKLTGLGRGSTSLEKCPNGAGRGGFEQFTAK